MILQRYVIKNIAVHLFFILSILTVIFLLFAYFHFVREAAIANLNPKDIPKILITEIPVLLQPILPLGFFLSIILVFKNLFSHNEIISMYSLGVSRAQLFFPILVVATLLSIFAAYMQLYLYPLANSARIHLIEDSLHNVAFDKIFPGQFNQLSADQVVYIDKKLTHPSRLEGIFYSIISPDQDNELAYDLVVAKSAEEYISPNKSKYVVFSNGTRYQAKLANHESLIMKFEKFAIRLSHPNYRLEDWPGCMQTNELFIIGKSNRYAAAEFHWRISIPISIINLSLFAIAYNSGRIRGYAKPFTTLYPLVVYLAYVNLLLMSVGLIKNEMLSKELGLWLVHALMMVFSVVTLRHRPE